MGIGNSCCSKGTGALQTVVVPKRMDRSCWVTKSLLMLLDGQGSGVGVSFKNHLEHIFFQGVSSSRKIELEQKCRGTHFCVPLGGLG